MIGLSGNERGIYKKAIAFYSQFVQGTLHRTNARTAEMCKLTENSSRMCRLLLLMSFL